METNKVCTVCKIESNFLNYRKDKNSKDGYTAQCKDCDKRYREINREKKLLQSKEYYQKNKERIKENYLLNREFTREEKNKRNRESYQKNKGNKLLKIKEYRNNNKEKVSFRGSEYYQRNKGRIDLKNARYHREHPEIRKRSSHVRRALKKKLGGILSKGIIEKLFEQQLGLCPCCGLTLGDDFHLDHIMPLALGGTNTDDNVQLLRAKCNLQKGA